MMIQASCSKCGYSFYCHNNASQCHAAFCCFIVYFCYIECYIECYIFTLTLNGETRPLLGRSQEGRAAPALSGRGTAGCRNPPVMSPFPPAPGPLTAVPVSSFYPLYNYKGSHIFPLLAGLVSVAAHLSSWKSDRGRTFSSHLLLRSKRKAASIK